MALMYRIQATMVFNNEADRDTWFNLIKTKVVQARDSGNYPQWTGAIMSKQRYWTGDEVDTDESLPAVAP